MLIVALCCLGCFVRDIEGNSHMSGYGMIPVGGGESGADQTGCFTKPQGGEGPITNASGHLVEARLNSPIRLIDMVWRRELRCGQTGCFTK